MSHLEPHRRDAGARAPDPAPDHTATPPDRGQATTEYALVMLAAALVALLVVAWATSGGGAGRIGQLFDGIIDGIMSRLP
jgi:hypothetical protein